MDPDSAFRMDPESAFRMDPDSAWIRIPHGSGFRMDPDSAWIRIPYGSVFRMGPYSVWIRITHGSGFHIGRNRFVVCILIGVELHRKFFWVADLVCNKLYLRTYLVPTGTYSIGTYILDLLIRYRYELIKY